MRERGWSEVVVKPAVSGGLARHRCASTRPPLERGEAHLRALAAREDVLVQPYLASVEGHGERAIVWIDGEATHAVRKSPALPRRRRVGLRRRARSPADEADLARRAVGGCRSGRAPLRAHRRGPRRRGGRPRLMELELIEPSLFFARAPAALDRYVAAVAKQLGHRTSATIST